MFEKNTTGQGRKKFLFFFPILSVRFRFHVKPSQASVRDKTNLSQRYGNGLLAEFLFLNHVDLPPILLIIIRFRDVITTSESKNNGRKMYQSSFVIGRDIYYLRWN